MTAKELRNRYIVRLRFEEGWTEQAIADFVGLTQGRISQLLHQYEVEGDSALGVKSPPGATPKLTPSQCEELTLLLDQGAEAHGFTGDVWTCPRVARLISDRFGVTYSKRGAGNLLHRLGYSLQKPQRVDRRQDPEKVRVWRAEKIDALKKSAD